MMGSRPNTEEELTVLVTGFAPFKTQYPVNPSWEIAQTLPAYLPPARAKDPSSAPPADMPPVRILVHPEAIRVNYKTVRGLVPQLWDGGHNAKIDVAIHIGMAGPKLQYSIEKLAHRDGYTKFKDIDDEVCDDDEKRKRDESDWIWDGCPEELETDFDTDDVLRRWQKHSHNDPGLNISTDPGRFLCDFIYFSSLAHLYKRHEHKRVIFLHVPSDPSDPAVSKGKELVLQLIRSLIESELVKKRAST